VEEKSPTLAFDYVPEKRLPATKDFMRPARTASVGSDHRFNSAPNTLGNVSTMRVSAAPNLPSVRAEALPNVRISNRSKVFAEETPTINTRASEMICPSDTRTAEIHLEASPVANGRAAVPASATGNSGLSLSRAESSPYPADMPKRGRKTDAAAACLFGDALPSAPTPQEQLREALQEAFRRRRGTQSRVAEALHLSRHTLSNVLAGRERFTPTAAAALRRWLDGEPMLAEWPHLPPAKDEGEPDAAA